MAADLGVKVGATRVQAAAFQDLVIGQRHFGRVVGELVGVPARLVIVAVHVDRPKDPQRGRQRQFMFERMARQDRVALFDVHLDLFFQAKLHQEAVNRGDIIVVLVL